jgi:DNA invertase Pin-like site-specific DNA recombinase
VTSSGRAIAYVRCSTDQQAESGLGLDAQRRAIEQSAARQGLAVAAFYEDAGLSGAKDIEARPGLLEAVSALRRGDVLLVAKRDRLGRDVVSVALIERLISRKGARVLSAAGEGTDTDDPTALLMRRIADAFSEHEGRVIRTRTKAALKAKRAQGLRAGNIPFGFSLAEDRKTLLPHTGEQQILEEIRRLRREGCSMPQIAAALNERGIVTRSGSAWRFEYIRRLLRTA